MDSKVLDALPAAAANSATTRHPPFTAEEEIVLMAEVPEVNKEK